MRIYDISQELFGCRVFPGDPKPERETVLSIKNGDICNLTAISLCAHNGTHVDAPFHFIDDGKTIDQVDLDRFIGYAYLAEHTGALEADDARSILEKAREARLEASERILIKGDAYLTAGGAGVFASAGIKLFGNESQTVGPEDAPAEVHRIMLGKQVVLLEGIRLAGIDEGVYFLHSAPLNLGGADGAPCRATLIEF